jgi:hypothetical protein
VIHVFMEAMALVYNRYLGAHGVLTGGASNLNLEYAGRVRQQVAPPGVNACATLSVYQQNEPV